MEISLQQIQLAGACNGFGAPLDLQLVKNFLIMPFDRIQGEVKPRANFAVRETLDDEPEHF